MVRAYKSEGIVLRRVNFNETDKLITLFSRKRGKAVLLAKGVRKIKSRRAPHLELFTIIEYTAHLGKNFDIITEASSVTANNHIRKDLARIALAYKFAEVMDRLCPEGERHEEIFRKATNYLNNLGSLPLDRIEELLLDFSHFLLWTLGYLPQSTRLDRSKMDFFLEEVMEKKLKSNKLLEHLNSHDY